MVFLLLVLELQNGAVVGDAAAAVAAATGTSHKRSKKRGTSEPPHEYGHI